MHSSRMHTACSLPYRGSLSSGALYVQGSSVQRGLRTGGGFSVRETHALGGQTNTCEIITLPHTSYAGGKNVTCKKTIIVVAVVQYEGDFTSHPRVTTLSRLTISATSSASTRGTV